MKKGVNAHALDEELLLCKGRRIPAWLVTALRDRARVKLEKEKGKSDRRDFREFVKWETFNWLRLHGVGYIEAHALTAKAFGKSEGGVSTIEHAVKNFKKKRGLRGVVPCTPGFEEGDPTDLEGGPDERTFTKLFSEWQTKRKPKN